MSFHVRNTRTRVTPSFSSVASVACVLVLRADPGVKIVSGPERWTDGGSDATGGLLEPELTATMTTTTATTTSSAATPASKRGDARGPVRGVGPGKATTLTRRSVR